ncbi:hypothetical protein GY45DRAFT_318730 [Cubamyces sp. BRFM 1775]|nr:hypothetical protein GY45DRAFT_318730 [Cubamyces sp. BRFM 1775]
MHVGAQGCLAAVSALFWCCRKSRVDRGQANSPSASGTYLRNMTDSDEHGVRGACIPMGVALRHSGASQLVGHRTFHQPFGDRMRRRGQEEKAMTSGFRHCQRTAPNVHKCCTWHSRRESSNGTLTVECFSTTHWRAE